MIWRSGPLICAWLPLISMSPAEKCLQPSLIPRPFPPPVFDRLQYATTEGGGLGDFVMYGYVRVIVKFMLPWQHTDAPIQNLAINSNNRYWTANHLQIVITNPRCNFTFLTGTLLKNILAFICNTANNQY